MTANESTSVWLIIRSPSGLSSDDISTLIGIDSNSRNANHPAGGKAFFMKSERDISDSAPLNEHLSWIAEVIKRQANEIRTLTLGGALIGEVFIYVFSDSHVGYIDLPYEFSMLFSSCGLNLSIKFEFSDRTA